MTAIRIKNYSSNNADKAVDNYAQEFEFTSNCFKTNKMSNKAFDNFLSTIQFVSDWYDIQEISDKVVETCAFETLILMLIDATFKKRVINLLMLYY